LSIACGLGAACPTVDAFDPARRNQSNGEVLCLGWPFNDSEYCVGGLFAVEAVGAAAKGFIDKVGMFGVPVLQPQMVMRLKRARRMLG
jgi:hypothetical protein